MPDIHDDLDPVMEALCDAFPSIDPYVTQAGGGSYVIRWDTPDGFYLLSDEDGPFVPGPISGWMVGFYLTGAEEEPARPLVSVVGDGSVQAAMGVVRAALDS